ncbi:MAG: hypothetical protein OXJ90_07105 [Spirochaetaceae bacterium]|nr:hypothetical protein [Spirochaetaceae bacterium]
MSDGPFKNVELGSRWKRFAAAAHNDAADPTERCVLAADAIVHEILTDETQALLSDLFAYVREDQLDLTPLSSIERIFHSHHKTAFGDSLQREVAYRLADDMPVSDAIDQALEASFDDHHRRARDRIEEECIRAREVGALRRDQFPHTVARANAAFDALPKHEICDALRRRNKSAFKTAASKHSGLDEGPHL